MRYRLLFHPITMIALLGIAGPSALGARGSTQAVARAVGPGVISTPEGESWITFDATGALAVFGRHANAGWNRHTIYVTRREGDTWSAPAVAPFSGTFEDRGARFSPDGRRLIFSSNRPRPGEGQAARTDFDLWIVERRGNAWAEPQLLPPPVSSDGNDFHASIASDGTIYFASSRPGGAGRSDLYIARRRGDMMVVEGLGPNINTAHSEPDVFVDPAQRFIIIARTDDPSGAGGDDLYISTQASGGEWSTPRNLGSAVNTAEYEYGPLVSADGSTLYFTSHRGGQANLYEIPARAVGIGGAN